MQQQLAGELPEVLSYPRELRFPHASAPNSERGPVDGIGVGLAEGPYGR